MCYKTTFCALFFAVILSSSLKLKMLSVAAVAFTTFDECCYEHGVASVLQGSEDIHNFFLNLISQHHRRFFVV